MKKSQLKYFLFIFFICHSLSFAEIRLNDILDDGTDSYTFDIVSSTREAFLVTQIPANFQFDIDTGSIRYTDAGFGMWQNLTFRGRISNAKLDIGTYELQPNGIRRGNTYLTYIGVDTLTIDKAEVDSEAAFRFLGTGGTINLQNNATLVQGSFAGYLVENGGTLTINNVSGDNFLYGWTQDMDNASLVYNIASGTSLLVGNVVNANFNSIQNIRGGASTINIANDGSFTLSRHRLDLEGGSAIIGTGATLKVERNNSKLSIDDVLNDGGKFVVETLAKADIRNRLILQNDATLRLLDRSDFSAKEVLVVGNNTLYSENNSEANISSLKHSSVSTLRVEGVISSTDLNIGTLDLQSDFTIDLQNKTSMDVDTLLLSGGRIDINPGSELTLSGIDSSSSSGTLDIQGNLTLRPGADLQLGAGYTVNLTSARIDVEGGVLSGDGSLGDATSSIRFKMRDQGFVPGISPNTTYQGTLSPGTVSSPFGKITTDANIAFYDGNLFSDEGTLNSMGGIFDGGVYQVDVGVDAGLNPLNDQLVYGAGDVEIQQLKELRVRTPGTPTAADLNGQVYTVIQAQNAGVAGTVQRYGQTFSLVEDGSVPALVDFTVVDLNTNGKSDVTLQADANINNIAKHSHGTKNRTRAANLLINANNSGNTAIASSLNTLTNAQMATHFDSIHAEPYSSYMTISLEHSDMVMNTVLNHAARNGVFSTGRSYEAVLPRTGNLYLASTGGMKTVGDVVQAHPLESHDRFWVDASYNEGDVDGDGELGDFNYSLQSLTVGQDLMVRNDRTLGAFFSIGRQKMDEHDAATQDFKGNNYYLGLYLNEADVGGWDLRGVLGYAFGDHDSRRTVVLSNSIATPTAGFNSHSVYAGVKGTVVGYQNDWVTLSPELGLSYTYYKQKSLTESGDPNLSLTVDSADAHAIIASAGANARFASLSETSSIYPLAFLHYEFDAYADSNNEHEIDAALAAHPEYRQTFVGQNRGEHAVTVGLGLGSDPTSALQIRGGVKYTAHSHGDEWGAGVDVQYFW